MATSSTPWATLMMDALLGLSRSLPGRGAEVVLAGTLDALLAGASAERGVAFAVAGHALDLVAGRGLTPELTERLRRLPLRGAGWFAAQRAARSGKVVLDRVIAPAERALFAEARWEQTVACPVAAGGEVLGVVVIAWPDVEQPDERVLAGIEIACHLAALEALRRAHPERPRQPTLSDAEDDPASDAPASLRQDELVALARAAADLLRREGPKEGAAVIAALCERGASEQEALEVLTYALSTGAVVQGRPPSKLLSAGAAAELRTVLVVDDDDDLRQTLSEILHDEGFTVETAANGREALDLLRERGKPRVLVLDLMMPVMDGWRLLAELRRDEALSGVPVIVISASGRAESAVGATAILPKPLDYYKLVTSVERTASSGAS